MAIVDIQPYDPDATAPPPEVISVLESGLSEHTRRVEFYESDAVTRWYPDPNNPSFERLIGGSVSVDYNSDERRKLDCTLDNVDGLLRQNPNGGFWYDKVLKVFRGVTYDPRDVEPHLAIIESEANDESKARDIALALASSGWRDNNVILGQGDLSILQNYSWIVSGMQTTATAYGSQLSTLWNAGKNIITFGTGNTGTQVPLYSTFNNPGGSFQRGIAGVTADTPTASVFTGGVSESVGSPVAGTMPTAAMGYTQTLAVWTVAGQPTFITAAMAYNPSGGVWIDIRLPNVTGTLTKKFIKTLLQFIRNRYSTKTWETQLGEFYIDQIGEANFPNQMKVTARDATKKLLNDKLSRSATFEVGTSLADFVIGQAALGGIPTSKMRFNLGDETLTTELSFDKGTSRWDMIKGALNSFNYEFFFDATGDFVIRPFQDPTTSPVYFAFGTGPDGNLVSFERSTNDSRIYNVIQVTAAPADNSTVPISYFGEARNDDPNSPTNTTRLGNRVLPIDADWLSSDEDCAALAADYLKISALESYELNFSSIYYAWLEVGNIVTIIDPDAYSFEPTRFLMDTIDLSLDLGPMSATGKRVTFVGSSGG